MRIISQKFLFQEQPERYPCDNPPLNNSVPYDFDLSINNYTENKAI